MTTTLEALQTTLAGEHAAVWTLAVLGARTSQSAQPTLAEAIQRSYLSHRARRDTLAAAVRDLGVEPVASAVAYELPGPALTGPQVRAAAGIIEDRCVATYADLVAGTAGARRRWAIAEMVQSAVRTLDFRDSPEIFPGLTELTDR